MPTVPPITGNEDGLRGGRGRPRLALGADPDEDIAEVFNFEEAKSVDIQLIAEFDKDGENMVAICGTTYPFNPFPPKVLYTIPGSETSVKPSGTQPAAPKAATGCVGTEYRNS